MRQLFIMIKVPRVGRVKTRLGAGLGLINATWWFRHHSARLIRRLGRDPRWKTTLAVSPDIDGATSPVWAAHLARWPQGSGNLGDRMRRIFQFAPHGPVLVIGADIPGITPALIDKAFCALGDHDAVFGPAPDGGFWLVGLRRTRGVTPTLFNDVRWSSEHALADTIGTLGVERVAMIDVLQDVDTVDDLRAL
jgi:rSAM/selenodomain-associated transferase 1